MFERLLEFFSGGPAYETQLPPADLPHAIGALLVRTAKADKAYLFEEVERIDAVLAKRYGLNPVEAAKMRAECEKLEEAMPDTEVLAQIIEDQIDIAEREAAVAALWSVVFADGVELEEEDAVVTAVSKTLGLPLGRVKALHDSEAAKRPPKRS